MVRPRKSDWYIALALAFLFTGIGVYTRRIDVLAYPFAITCMVIAIWMLIDEKKPDKSLQNEESESPAARRRYEKYAIPVSCVCGSATFFSLGFSSPSQAEAFYRFGLPAIIIVAPFLLFSVFIFDIVAIRSLFSRNSRSDPSQTPK